MSLLDHLLISHLKAHLQSRLIMSSMCINELTRSQLPCLHSHGFPVHFKTHLIVASKCLLFWPPCSAPNFLDHSFLLYLWVHLISASHCISKLALSWRPVHLSVHTMTTSKSISGLTQLSSSGAPRFALKHHLQPAQIYRVQMDSYVHT